MKPGIVLTTALLLTFGASTSAFAINPDHVKLLLSTKACPGCDLRGATFEGTDLRGANLAGANLQDARLQQVNLEGANLAGATLERANLERARLKNANFTNATLRQTNLARADLERATLRGAKLVDANLPRVNLRRADLRSADLRDAVLLDADLERANLERANLDGADLRRANLSNAMLRRANTSGARMDGVNLSGADISGTDLEREQRRGLELVVHLHLAELLRRLVARAATHEVRELVAAQVLAAREPDAVRAAPPLLVVAGRVDARAARLVVLGDLGERVVAQPGHAGLDALLGRRELLVHQARDALVLPRAFGRAAEEGVSAQAQGVGLGGR